MARNYRDEVGAGRALLGPSRTIQDAMSLGLMTRRQGAAEAAAAAQEIERQRATDEALSQAVYGSGGGTVGAPAAGTGRQTKKAAAAAPAQFSLADIAPDYREDAPFFIQGTPLEGTTAPVGAIRQYLTNPRMAGMLPEMSPRALEENLAEYGDYRAGLVSDLSARRQEAGIEQAMTALSLTPEGKGATPDALRAMATSQYYSGAVDPVLARASSARSTVGAARARAAPSVMQQQRLNDQWRAAVEGKADQLQEEAVAAGDPISRTVARRRAKLAMSPVQVAAYGAETDRMTAEGKALDTSRSREVYAQNIVTARMMVDTSLAVEVGDWTPLKKDTFATFLANNPSVMGSVARDEMSITDAEAFIRAHAPELQPPVGEDWPSDISQEARDYATQRGIVWSPAEGKWVVTQELLFPNRTPVVTGSRLPKSMVQALFNTYGGAEGAEAAP